MRAGLLAENYRGATACNYRVIDKITRKSWQSNTGRPLFWHYFATWEMD